MGIPIVIGASERVRRTGGTFRARCPRCGDVKMYEAVKHLNVSAFLAISLWDEEDPVVQCGECLGVFNEEDGKKLRGTSAPALGPSPPAPKPTKRPAIDESAIDAELAAMKKRLGKG